MVKRTNGNGGFYPRVVQAQGMVAEQLGCSLPDAMEAMLRYSEETDRSLEKIADDVVEDVIRFDQ
jgi:hypothetical protein